jgi:pimeloyl-ACP methyl ester carboxylesterase
LAHLEHVMANADAGRLTVHGIELEVLRRGTGRPILALHGFDTIDPAARFLDLLSRHGEVIAPSSPGFGNSPRPKDFDTVYDLVHLYLAALEALPGDKVTLLGFSFGGWLAAEVAAACSHRLEKFILVDPLGIKISDRETPDILDIFNRSPDEVRRRSWHDPDRFASSTPAIARRCASMPGTPTCTTRNCRAGSAGSRRRPCWFGVPATAWSARITAAPIAG